MAQLVEQRIRNAWVRGSSPLIGFVSDTFCIGYPIQNVSFYFKKCLFLRHEIGIMGADKENKNKG